MSEVDVGAVIELLEEATLSDPGTFPVSTPLHEVEGWDSMGMVMFISLVTERFRVELTAHDLRECGTADELQQRIAERVTDAG